MTELAGPPALSTSDRKVLAQAVEMLESRGFAIKIANMVGQPITSVVGLIPSAANRRIMGVLESALHRCLNIAIESLDGTRVGPPPRTFPKVMVGLTGGIGGVFGAFSLPVELPMTTIVILQTIADIARHNGEDLSRLETRLACLEVFALGSGPNEDHRSDVSYYATRSMLTQIAGEVATIVGKRQTIDATTPVVARLIGEIASRFGVTVSERAAASAVPIIGAIGGATVNVLFMDHFQQVAEGHFAVRRLERKYGAAEIQFQYRTLAREAKAPIR